jgi:8-oxo-dGTP diphosphatase
MKIKEYNNVSYLPKDSILTTHDSKTNEEEIGKSTSAFCFIFKKNKIALLKHTNKEREFDIPGGHLEEGENSLQAMKRETLEEIGCTLKDIKLLGYQVIKKDKPEKKYPDLISNQIFYYAKLKEIVTTELEEDSQGLIFMKREEFLTYLKDKESLYLDLFKLIPTNNLKKKEKSKNH